MLQALAAPAVFVQWLLGLEGVRHHAHGVQSAACRQRQPGPHSERKIARHQRKGRMDWHVLVCCRCTCRMTMYHTIPYHTIPYHTILYHTIPYHTIPHHTIPYHTILYHTIPYHTIPYHAHVVESSLHVCIFTTIDVCIFTTIDVCSGMVLGSLDRFGATGEQLMLKLTRVRIDHSAGAECFVYLYFILARGGPTIAFAHFQSSQTFTIPYHTIPYHTIPYHTMQARPRLRT